MMPLAPFFLSYMLPGMAPSPVFALLQAVRWARFFLMSRLHDAGASCTMRRDDLALPGDAGPWGTGR